MKDMTTDTAGVLAGVETKLAPRFMLRVAGISLQSLLEWQAPKTIDRLSQITEHTNWLAENTQPLVDRLEAAVPKMTDDVLRNQLIKYKRDIFNSRFPKKRPPEFAGQIAADLIAAMQTWEAVYQLIAELEQDAKAHYEHELRQSRIRMQELAQDPYFQNGVVQTSQELYTKILKYIETPIDEHSGRLRKVEYNLSTVLTRTGAKTSPFSSFTLVGHGEWDEQGQMSLASLQQYRSKLRINHTFVLRLFAGLLKRPEIRPLLAYRANRSSMVSNGQFRMMRRTDNPKRRPRVFRTSEAHVSLHYNPSIQTVLEKVKQAPGGMLSFEALLGELAGIGQREEIEKFLGQLIELQILEPTAELTDQTPDILADVQGWLQRWPVEIARRVADKLQEVQAMIAAFETASVEERKELLSQLTATFESLYAEVGVEADASRFAMLLYEDAVLPEPTRLPADEWQGMVQDLARLQELSPLFDVKYRLQSRLAQMFRATYGADGVCTRASDLIQPLVAVNQEFFRAMVPEELHADLGIGNDVENIRILNELKVEFGRMIAERLLTGEEVVLCAEDLEAFTARIPESIRNRPMAHDFFVQWQKGADGRSLLVLNQAYHGFLTFFTRFLEYGEGDEVQELRAYLAELFEGTGRFAEVSGVYGFNANLREPLASHELTFPDLPPTWPEGQAPQTLRFHDLSWVYDQATDRVVLQHPEIGIVQTAFLGTLIPLMLPSLVRMVTNLFTNSLLPLNFHSFHEHTLTEEQRLQDVRVYPRVRVGQVVVSRQKWMVPRSRLIEREKKESDFEFFSRVHRWRTNLGLPSRVFIRFMPMTDAENPFAQMFESKEAEQSQVNFTSFKPQYIDFASPLLVRLFGKIIGDTTFGMKIEEMLPEADGMFYREQGRPHVTEMTVELGKPGGRG
ncbi:lantibiotic biosynthesis dehydratase-like protein [Tumebacillus sp. BK434]|uniref:lantibiotic dehydratase n=1 Tax=Tumebacillus sp. BK434 TaxID=2512169 RepID=UPI0010EDC1E0|nr:lantibiotic dehydratase [Tumebacillus sp. BK434]TCP59062.1 lantibiotic biosynthesis dehydratase-like protein [Tumebacillus sp. BK434]